LGVRAPPGSPSHSCQGPNFCCGFWHAPCRSDTIHHVIPGPLKRIFHFGASSSQLGPLEERLLDALWQRGNATVRELVDSECNDLAYTTVMTTLDRLFKKSLLAREEEGRAFRYTPRFTREGLHREVAAEAFRQLLDASPSSTLPLSYLVEIVSERDAQLLDQLREAVDAKRRELRLDEGKARTDPKTRTKNQL
jgi:predicted transcriptional regulator